MSQSKYIGIEIGGTKLQLVTGTAEGQITDRIRLNVDQQRGGEGIREQIASALPKLKAPEVAGIGVGFGGPVDRASGQIACSHQIQGWADFPFRDWLEGQSKLKVTIDNDANTAALGEALCGAGRGKNPVFYVTLGSGVGGGLVVDEAIYHGAAPGEAEIGHVRLNRQGTIVEQSCSGWSVDRKIREGILQHPESRLSAMVGQGSGGEARHLGAALQAGDALARNILEQTCEDLAFALSHVTHLFHPAIIVIGGGLSLLGEPLREATARSLRNYIMEAFGPGPQVALAQLGEDAVPVGALKLASVSR
jgi:glucokinase